MKPNPTEPTVAEVLADLDGKAHETHLALNYAQGVLDASPGEDGQEIARAIAENIHAFRLYSCMAYSCNPRIAQELDRIEAKEAAELAAMESEYGGTA